MSIAAVTELSHELRRLAIAGASLAPGDHRIAKLIPSLEKSGAKAPVFGKIAEAAQHLVDSDRKSAAEKLLKANAIVMAVLKTQGKSSVDGDISTLTKANLTGNQPISARVLEDLKTALTTSMQGRMETIQNAYDRGYFGDIRLAEASITALSDNNHEIANLAAEKLIPPYGPGIAQILAAKLDPTAKKPGARLLLALHGCHADAAAEIGRTILEGGEAFQKRFRVEESVAPSMEVRAASLQCLSASDEDQGILLDHIKAKNKPLRVAALSRLIEQKHPDAEEIVLEKLKGSATKQREAIESLPSIHAPGILEAVEEMAEGHFKNIGKSTLVEANTLIQLLTALVKSPVNKETLPLAIRTLENLKKIHRRYKDESWSAIHNVQRMENLLFIFLANSKSKDAFNAIVDHFPGVREPSQALAAMLTLSSPAEVWKKVGKELEKPKYKNKIGTLFCSYYNYYFSYFTLPPAKKWSKPWLELGLKMKNEDMVSHLFELDPSAVAKDYLARKEKFKSPASALLCLAGNPKKFAEVAKKITYSGYWWGYTKDSFEALMKALKDKKPNDAKVAAAELRAHLYDDRLGDIIENAIKDHFKKK